MVSRLSRAKALLEDQVGGGDHPVLLQDVPGAAVREEAAGGAEDPEVLAGV